MRILFCLLVLFSSLALAQAPRGYYRSPAIHGEVIVFTAEGDLWRVSVAGGVARRLTTHPKQEIRAAISPDGSTIAFNASYEGPQEIFTMPLSGGLPKRRTWDGGGSIVRGWTPAGEILYSTRNYSTLPNTQLVALDLKTGERRRIPLAQADHGSFDPDSGALFFTRLPMQGSQTKRYQGGSVQQIWRFSRNAIEAAPLTTSYSGTSRHPMWFDGRVYFATDRDGTMNLWSMDPMGKSAKQLTRHKGWDIADPAQQGGRIVYQLGADLNLYDIAGQVSQRLDIRLASDLDQLREKWIDEPFQYLDHVDVSPDGERVVLTARGRVFVAPVQQGRFVEVVRKQGVRYRDAKFLPDGESLFALSDESGEVEFWKLPANGLGEAEPLTAGGDVLRWQGAVSPDGRWLAHDDKGRRLWLLNLETNEDQVIREAPYGFNSGTNFGRYVWSPDSKWLAFVEEAPNTFARIILYSLDKAQFTELTTDRYNSFAPAWSPDGKWLYFLSDRHLESAVPSPWGTRQPEPFFHKTDKIYHVALQKGARSPFQPDDELTKDDKKENDSKDEKKGDERKFPDVQIDLDGIQSRLQPVPAPPGNYSRLAVTDKKLLWLSRDMPRNSKRKLLAFEISNEPNLELETYAENIDDYRLSPDGKHLLLREEKKISVFPSDKKPPSDSKERAKHTVRLNDWKFSVNPREELRQIFVDAWRLERDYFYDPGMHGVDWQAMREKYEPLVDRVTDRAELSDLIAQMVSELSALHIFVFGGDFREGTEKIQPARLGARLSRDANAGGYRVEHIYQHDPDRPEEASPLARPGAKVEEGAVILAINGVPVLSHPDIGTLLREEAGKQVRLSVRSAAGEERDVIVRPVTPGDEADLRYQEWEYTRRQKVERLGQGKIGYVHLRAMSSANITQWARQFYPVFHRQGLILDVRHNTGGNIDSWLLGKLLRKAWFYWKPRGGKPFWNMQYAFDGHMVALINERTASDGEAFAEGFRQLGLGKLIGTRTWGGEIWLSASNRLVDRGIATAAEIGVYGPEGDWLIEGHGVDPDIEVDNLPHATFHGKDAQLEAAVQHLLERIEADPPARPAAPPYPDKSWPGPEER